MYALFQKTARKTQPFNSASKVEEKVCPGKEGKNGGRVKFVSFSVALLSFFRQNLQQSIFCGLFLRKGGVEIGDDFGEDGGGGANGCDLGSGLTYFQFSI